MHTNRTEEIAMNHFVVKKFATAGPAAASLKPVFPHQPNVIGMDHPASSSAAFVTSDVAGH